jgi:hypothetical protein
MVFIGSSAHPLLFFDATSTSYPRVSRPSTHVLRRPQTMLERHLTQAFRPYSICGIESPLLFPERVCPATRKCRPQGLATLSTDSAFPPLGSLFQLPTLLGFALQSFTPFR